MYSASYAYCLNSQLARGYIGLKKTKRVKNLFEVTIEFPNSYNYMRYFYYFMNDLSPIVEIADLSEF